MNELTVFSSELGNVRAMEINGEPWFVGKDVAEVLGYKNTRDAISKHVDAEDKDVANCDTLGGNQDLTLINESGLYSLILKSKLPSAKAFKRWVTSELLPTLRKTGSYKVQPMSTMEQIRLTMQGLLEIQDQLHAVESDLAGFKNELPLLGCDMERVTAAVKKVGVEALGGKGTEAYKDVNLRGKVYSDIYSQLKREFGVSSYKSIRRNELSTALDILLSYKLPLALQEEVNFVNAQMTQKV